jgi:dimethyladenosine transferase 1, mitochondrial
LKEAIGVLTVELMTVRTLQQLADANDHRLKILQGDAMKVPHSDILKLAGIDCVNPLKRIHIVGNLPFNVATPLLIQWLHLLQQRNGLFGSAEVWMTLMFQKEVAQRICAPVNTSDRGRLSVITQTLCSANIPYVIPSSAFLPKPKVRENNSLRRISSPGLT